MLPTKFRFNWLSSFREKDFQKSTNLKQELSVAAMLANESGRKQRTFHRCFLPSLGSFGKVVSVEKIFQKSTNQKQEWPVVAMFVNELGRNEQSLQKTFHRCFLPNFSSFGKAVSVEKIFQKSTNQKQEWPVAAMFANGSELNELSLQRTSKDASYQILIHLARRFKRRRFFRNQPIRNKNGLWRPCLRNNSRMTGSMLILTWVRIIFVKILHLAFARCKIS